MISARNQSVASQLALRALVLVKTEINVMQSGKVGKMPRLNEICSSIPL